MCELKKKQGLEGKRVGWGWGMAGVEEGTTNQLLDTKLVSLGSSTLTPPPLLQVPVEKNTPNQLQSFSVDKSVTKATPYSSPRKICPL
jgi:hypothetical protein